VDRTEAGRRLAALLDRFRGPSTVVLGVPRGGVPVAYEIAKHLGCPLDVLLVRKVGAPGDPEYGLGAVAEGGVVRLDESRAHDAGFSVADLAPIVRRETEELADRAARFRRGSPPLPLEGRTTIVVDDGVATGGTVEAGLESVRARSPRAIVVALGVAPPSAIQSLRRRADEVVTALAPRYLEAVGQWYRHFEPVDDAQVVRLQELARRALPGAGFGPAS